MEKWERDLEKYNNLIAAFDDTCRMAVEDDRLSVMTESSIKGQVVIPEDAVIMNAPVMSQACKQGNVMLSSKKTLEAAKAYSGKHIAVLNFGCATAPGGGGKKGRLTQEECLCRQTALYPSISSKSCIEDFYDKHKELGSLYNADMIYTPHVTVFKSDDDVPKILPRDDWFGIDVITMAAPDVSCLEKCVVQGMDNRFMDIFEKRFVRVMQAAAVHDVDVLILGAFGCGEFGNDPAIVAAAAARALDAGYRNMFDTVEFAVYGKKKTNYRMFRLVLDRYLNGQGS